MERLVISVTPTETLEKLLGVYKQLLAHAEGKYRQEINIKVKAIENTLAARKEQENETTT